MVNYNLAKILREISVLLEIKGENFKPQAYEKAAHSVEMLEQDVREIYKDGGIKALEDIPGVGKGIALRIEEYLKTHRVKDYDKLKKQIPVQIDELFSIEGVGPKMILRLYNKLGIKTRAQLEKAAQEGKLRDVEGFGRKTEENILRSIGFLKKDQGRFILGFVMPTAKMMLEKIRALPEVQSAEYAGSLRRKQETIGDLDFIVFSEKPGAVIKKFLDFPEIKHVYSQGEHKSLVRLDTDIDADISVISPKSLGSALIAWTGSKQHNIAIRTLAEKRGWLLNDYGLWDGNPSTIAQGKGKLLASKTEEEVYKKLGMDWIPPEIRNGTDEITAALEGTLPNLIGYGDLKGDLQVQTDWTDGDHSIKEMAEAAKKLGLEYICITDHTKSLAMTGGNDEKGLLKEMAAIDKIQKQVSGIKILKGAEVNIMKDGSLDIDDETLAKLDVVGAAVHSHFNLSEKDQTARIIRAMENPNVDIIFHPTGRIIQRRDAYKVDMDALLKAAKRTKTVMEIDAYPDRSDLKDEYIRKAVDPPSANFGGGGGVKLSIDTDAHSIHHFQYLEYGIAQARRGWAEKKDVINTRGLKKMLEQLK
ncbi:MAG: DNA polymerase III [Candidatus Yanofskybacteria bacterium RIFCSPHIGHO2_01_FULL_43_42]|uniref:DNA polymerase beta n=1 Tax=Candidatus Yanofskybacteria bacterium RIFCSPLOWO2_01_FULL_43_22 TaxID=1802695 RepID=A0A1F8GHM6_9BACT|nr:MAG: DNA polymerase III [Candidatus Yanofskybacteria bacterium RIFCSPHIGHO2_01_FULL_43_42]OGN13137.1 MAG: DNA polymerase III [Candidatus Yanofskybacteria bacterium RIFCSPHIGHO2_02_FULL_43_17]OGN24550.1 MAG: DNA polymerase III [Candidatus Yanofskybacteria bacterium RIFCSPLOWO2_01_FULL_43_22]